MYKYIMFLVCEAIAWGMEHVPFNAAFLRTIRLAYPDDTICFYAEESHSGHVREQIGEEFAASIIWKKLILPPRHSSFYARLTKDFKNVKFLLNQLNENPKNHVLVITGNPSLLWAIKYYVCTIHKDKKIQVIIHGDFSKLRYRISIKNILNPFYHIGSLKTALKIPGYRRIQQIVLEESIRDAVLEHMPFLRNSVSVLDHPIPVDEHHSDKNNFDPPIQFGFLGRATEEKGFSKYLTVAAAISKLFPGRAKFYVVGRISDQYKRANHPGMAFLSELPGTERMSRSEYVNRLKSLHFTCLFYDKYYEFSASGALMDSMAWEKPIVATRLPIFENLENFYGDIGYLCRADEFSETISSIIQQNDSDRYKCQVLNIRRARMSRTPETLAIKYRELVNRFYN